MELDSESIKRKTASYTSSKVLSLLALSIWLISLLLTAIDFEDGSRHAGIQILLEGWMGIGFGCFAWFANVFFFVGLFRLLSGKSASVPSAIALLLSFDTFRFTSTPVFGSAGLDYVYGYGWGAVLWFLSVCLLTAAAGTQEGEMRLVSGKNTTKGFLRPVGLVLFGCTLIASARLSFVDYQSANPSEFRRLDGLAFKRSAVCTSNNLEVVEPIKGFSGPLQLDLAISALYAKDPFGNVKTLLAWGIPAIRVDDMDYSFSRREHEDVLIGRRAMGPATASITVAEDVKNGYRSIFARLVEISTNRIVFDARWRQELHNERRYCPDFKSSPGENDQPRILLMQALDLPRTGERSLSNPRRPRTFDTVRVLATVVSRSEGGQTRDMRRNQWLAEHHGQAPELFAHEEYNTNCPSDLGWRQVKPDSGASRLGVDWPFMVGDTARYLEYRQEHNATCLGNSVFIYSGGARESGYYLTIEKRNLPDFRKVWAGVVMISDRTIASRDDALRVQSVDEESDGMLLKVVDQYTGITAILKSPRIPGVQ